MRSPDKEFRLVGGNTEQSAISNRINAIERIKHLTGVDLRSKSKYYLYALDMELYQRWYKDMPKDHRIDEEWCQRAAEVVRSMEKDANMYDKATELAGRVATAYKEHEGLPLKEPPKKAESNSIINKLTNIIRRKK